MPCLSTRNIFQIPELVQLVNSYLKPCHSVNLACANRSIFYMVMPLLWKRVDGIIQFFPLFQVSQNVSRRKSKRSKAPRRKGPVADFSRFNAYAPWVEHLEIFKRPRDRPSEEQLNALYHYSATHDLLPNLRSMTFITPWCFVELPRIVPFLSPSLTSLELGPIGHDANPDISVPAFSFLLNALSKKCPDLRALAVSVASTKSADNDIKTIIKHTTGNRKAEVQNWIKRGLGPSLSGIRPLSSFTTSADILDDFCLNLISTWPSLEYLEIAGYRKDLAFSGLPESAFPSLKHLGFCGYSGFDIFRSVPALVGKLLSVKCIGSDGCYSIERDRPLALRFLLYLAEQGLHIQSLRLRVCDAKYSCFDTPVSVLGALQQLPLQALHIEGIYLTECENVPEWLAATFPDLREIGLPDHRVAYEDLREFQSKMPKLESLCLGLEDKPPSPDLNVNLDDIERYRHSPFHTLEVAFRKPYGCMGVNKIKSYTYHQVILLIRYLFVLWPNIRVVETKDPGTFLTNDGTPITMMALINDHLAMLSCCNRDPTLSYERVKIFNEESWNESLRVIVRRVD